MPACRPCATRPASCLPGIPPPLCFPVEPTPASPQGSRPPGVPPRLASWGIPPPVWGGGLSPPPRPGGSAPALGGCPTPPLPGRGSRPHPASRASRLLPAFRGSHPVLPEIPPPWEFHPASPPRGGGNSASLGVPPPSRPASWGPVPPRGRDAGEFWKEASYSSTSRQGEEAFRGWGCPDPSRILPQQPELG